MLLDQYKNAIPNPAAYKILEKLAKTDPEMLLSFLNETPRSFLDQLVSFNTQSTSFLNHCFRNNNEQAIDFLLENISDTEKFKQELASERFILLCFCKQEWIKKLLPEGFKAKANHWSLALLNQNKPLLDILNYPVESKRAIKMIENYFFDLKFTQFNYLAQFIEKEHWPLRLFRDAVTRKRGPMIQNLLLTHALENPNLSKSDIWDTISELIKHKQMKHFDIIVDFVAQHIPEWDWDRKGLVSDFLIGLGDNPIQHTINTNKLGQHKEMQLLTLAILHNDLATAEKLLSFNAQLPAHDTITFYHDYICDNLSLIKINKHDRDMFSKTIDSTYGLLLMEHAAAGKAKQEHLMTAPQGLKVIKPKL